MFWEGRKYDKYVIYFNVQSSRFIGAFHVTLLKMEGKTEEVEDLGSASSGSVIDDSDDGSSTSEQDDRVHLEVNLVEVFSLLFLCL